MCIGIPMKVDRLVTEYSAHCIEQNGSIHLIDTRLVGEAFEGEWLLVFHDAARERLSDERADQINNALAALFLVNAGSDALDASEAIDHLFADLVSREPTLPSHLQSALQQQNASQHED
jgi:hydrogenase expression/formation protein HypC